MCGMVFFIGFLCFIFAPFELYLAHADDFWFAFSDIAKYCLCFFAVYIFISCFLAIVMKKSSDIYRIVCYLSFLPFLALYIQGNFLIVDYGELDGSPIDWSEFLMEGAVSVCCFLAIVVVGICIYVHAKDKESVIKWGNRIAVFIIIIQVMTIMTLIISNGGVNNNSQNIVTDKNEEYYSEKGNIIVVILDTYDARVFDELYQEYKTEIENKFKDFIWYRNITCTYRKTDLSIPEILTGECYFNERSYEEYLDNAYSKSTLINSLEQNGYLTDIYINAPIPQNEVSEHIDNWQKSRMRVSSHSRLLVYFYKLIGFRYVPQPFKQFFWTTTEEIEDMRVIDFNDDTDLTIVNWGNDCFRDSIGMIKRKGELPKFSVIHLRGIHAPRHIDSSFNYVEEGVSLEESAKVVNLILGEYLEKLDEIGVYDNSTIVIMADHGAKDYDSIGFAQSPLFMIKSNCTDHFTIDETPVSFRSVQKILIDIVNDNYDGDISEYREDSRMFYETDWKVNKKNMTEYIITGHSFDTTSIISTGRVIDAYDGDEK